jgi:hypothetical protein
LRLALVRVDLEGHGGSVRAIVTKDEPRAPVPENDERDRDGRCERGHKQHDLDRVGAACRPKVAQSGAPAGRNTALVDALSQSARGPAARSAHRYPARRRAELLVVHGFAFVLHSFKPASELVITPQDVQSVWYTNRPDVYRAWAYVSPTPGTATEVAYRVRPQCPVRFKRQLG